MGLVLMVASLGVALPALRYLPWWLAAIWTAYTVMLMYFYSRELAQEEVHRISLWRENRGPYYDPHTLRHMLSCLLKPWKWDEAQIVDVVKPAVWLMPVPVLATISHLVNS